MENVEFVDDKDDDATNTRFLGKLQRPCKGLPA